MMPRTPPPVPGVAVNVLFRSATVTIQDWCCRGADRNAEEAAQGHVVAVTRRGAYLRQIGRDRVFADSGTAVFCEPGQPYRVSHPVQGGDLCTLFVLPPEGVRQLVGRHVPADAAQATPTFLASHAAIDCRTFLLHRVARDAAIVGEDPLVVEETALGFVERALQAADPTEGAAAARVVPLRTARDYAERVRAIVAPRFRERLSLVEIAHEDTP